MSAAAAAGLMVVICLVVVTVRQVRPEFGTVLLILGGCAAGAVCLEWIAPIVEEINSLSSDYAVNEGFKIVLKSVGICFIAQTAADTCRDASCASLAVKVETTGKIAVLIVVFPLLRSLLETAIGIING